MSPTDAGFLAPGSAPAVRDLHFLSGGAMGAVMRTHDWSASLLGHPETWPQSLRSVVGLMLGSKFPMFVAWGEELGFLYNDSYAEILGAKHPDALGTRFHDIWAEIWPDISPLIDKAMAGEASYHESLPLLMNRRGYDEQTWFTFSYSPAHDESGRIAGMFCACTETTSQVRNERRQAFVLNLQERLTALSEPRAVMEAAVKMLGQHLGAVRVGYSEVQADNETILFASCFADGVEPITGTARLADFGPRSIERQRLGMTEVCADVMADPAQVQETWAAIQTRAFVSVPLVRDGRFTASLYVNFRQPHRWTPDEVALVEDVAARTWDAVGRARAEAALRESEARLRTLTDNLPSGVVYQMATGMDGRDRRFLFLSQSHEALTGVPAEAVLADPTIPYRLILPEYREALVQAEADAIRERRLFDVETQFRRTDGEVRWCRILSAPREQPHGSLIWDGFQVDITDRKLAEARLRELNETLEACVAEALADRQVLADIVESTDASVMACDLDYRILAINKANIAASEQAYGKRPQIGDNLLEFVADLPELRARVTELWGRALAGEEFVILEEFGDVTRGGVAYEIRFNVLKDRSGQRVGACQTAYQVTDRLRAQAELEQAREALRQSQKMEAMGQLTGGVAHDFNNLLTPIVGSLDRLQRKGLGDERDRKLIEGAMQSAERASTLVQRLLAFARRQPLQPTAVDVRALIHGMADLVASTSGPRVRVGVEVASDLPAALADANQLEMAILNLAVNARDAMPEGGTLTMAAAAEEVAPNHRSKLTPGRYVRLSVADTGTGMSPEVLARAIEPFFSTKGIGKGTGLGLSMVHGLAAQLGGALSITSRPGLGTNVELWLPAGDELPSSEERTTRTALAVGTGTVLLVDDEELVRASTADMLADLGYAVVEASSAEEALRLVQEGLAPDLLVTDHLMPGLSGTELAREVRSILTGTPVLIVSGYAEVAGIAPDLPRLTKPFRQGDLAVSLAAIAASALREAHWSREELNAYEIPAPSRQL